MDYEFMTPSRLWADYDPEAVPLDVNTVGEVEVDGMTYGKYYFTSEKANDGDARIFCKAYHRKSNDKGVAVIYAGDLFRGSDSGMTQALANAGYLVVDIDLGANHGTEYPVSLARYGKPDSDSSLFCRAEPSAKNTSWYFWAKVLRRAAVFIRNCLGVDRIAVISENTACTAAYMTAGIDDTVFALGTIFGSGYIAYRGMYKYGGGVLQLDEERQCFISGVDAQTYATRFGEKPVAMLLSTNGFFGDFDRAMDLFDGFQTNKALIISPMLRDRITASAALSLLKWLDSVSLGGAPAIVPTGNIVISEDQYYLNVIAGNNGEISDVTAYYSVTNAAPYYREWIAVKAEETEAGEYIARLDFHAEADILFAFANVSYKDGSVLSTKAAVASNLSPAVKNNRKSRIIYSSGLDINFIPISPFHLIADGGDVTIEEGAFGINGLTSKEGAMVNYGIGSADKDGRVVALQLDVFAKESKSVSFSLYKSAVGEGKYTCRVDFDASTEWQRISLEPSMFAYDGDKLSDFGGVMMLEVEDAKGVLFNNILLV